MDGPIEGSRHDARMLRESAILPTLETNFNNVNGIPFSLYGDPAYPNHMHSN